VKKTVVKWFEGSQPLTQALSSGLEFCFLSEDNRQISPFAYCKDYLQDAIQGHLLKKRRSIYGFTYDPKIDPPICLNNTRILVANSTDSALGSKIPNCLDFLHQIEKKLRLVKTVVSECQSPPLKYIRSGVWLFKGSCRWMKSPPMISLYTLLIRLGFGHKIGTPYQEMIDGVISGKIPAYQFVDSGRLLHAKNGIDRILKIGDQKIFGRKIENNYPRKIRIGTMHNHLGIIGFSTGESKNHIPVWHKDEV